MFTPTSDPPILVCLMIDFRKISHLGSVNTVKSFPIYWWHNYLKSIVAQILERIYVRLAFVTWSRFNYMQFICASLSLTCGMFFLPATLEQMLRA